MYFYTCNMYIYTILKPCTAHCFTVRIRHLEQCAEKILGDFFLTTVKLWSFGTILRLNILYTFLYITIYIYKLYIVLTYQSL